MDKNFKFSIITALYNTEKYLAESIESVIKQDIGFKNNVQLILVDDGSTDNSKEIALKYQKLYPENILLLSKENGGVASARNLGLKYVKGEYVNFLDSDDTFPKNTLSVIDNFFNENNVNIVSMPLIYFDNRKGEHYLNYKYEKEGIIDLNIDYDYPQLHLSSSFIKKDALKNHTFKTEVVNGSDMIFMNEILVHEKKYGVVNSTNYNYRKRPDETSIMDNARKSKRFFTEKLTFAHKYLIDYSVKNENDVPKFIQYVIALDINGIIVSKYFNEFIFTKKDLKDFWNVLNYILDHIDEEVILNHRFLKKELKSFYIYLKNKSFNIDVDYDLKKIYLKTNDHVINNLNNHKINFDIVEIDEGFLNISGQFVSNCYDNVLSVDAIVKKPNGEEKIYSSKQVKYPTTLRDTRSYLNIDWRFYHIFDLKIPLSEEDYKITFRLKYSENNENIFIFPKIRFKNYCNLFDTSNYFVYDSKIVLFKKNAIHVVKYSKKFRLKLEKEVISNINKSDQKYKDECLKIRKKALLKSFFMKNKRIWLFIDRNDVADDNAEHLFKYAIKQKDGIEKYFIIDENSPDYSRLKKISKNIVPFGSEKHKLLYIFAEKIISSHITKNILNPFENRNKKLYIGLSTAKIYFLQHGVTKEDISWWVRKFFNNIHLFLTVSDLERDSIVNGHYNYDQKIVKTLGFPRFDNLENKNLKNQILYSPTWRNSIKTKEMFLKSNYYKTLTEFFNDKELIKLLDENNYKLIFKPHYKLLEFIDCLEINNENIIIDTYNSYQTLFNESKILITDFSSVAFDFAYLKKPIIYFQPEDNTYHTDEGYFKYNKMGFGDVTTSQYDLISKIKDYINNNCKIEEKYIERIDKFFKYNDKNNSKRVYEWLKKH